MGEFSEMPREPGGNPWAGLGESLAIGEGEASAEVACLRRGLFRSDAQLLRYDIEQMDGG